MNITTSTNKEITMGEYLQQQYRNSLRELNDIENKRRKEKLKIGLQYYYEKFNSNKKENTND